MSLSDSFNSLLAKKNLVIDVLVAEMFSELQTITPVQTGQLKGAWGLEKVAEGHYRISNNMTYAEIIFEGRGTNAKGEKYNLPDGLHPILMKYNILLTQRLDAIKV